jgi:two-component system, response regulator, stage 0 sporulation protein F
MSKKTTLLYVDDEPINIMLFEANFNRNYQVITANSGFEGLEKLRINPEISVVVSDMKMPEMNGIQFIVKAKKDYANIKYFILSGYELTDEIVDALNNKLILKYFKKPFNMKEIEENINNAFKIE